MNERECAVGLDRRTEFVYRMMLRRRRWRPSELAAVLDTTEEWLGGVVAELREEGLVTASADDEGALRAVEPALALPPWRPAGSRTPRAPGCRDRWRWSG